MHKDNPSRWSHEHVFDRGNPAGERGTRWVVWITAAAMVLEIVAGWWFNSMALLADGWHMGTHALAIGLSTLAYSAARRYSRDRRFAFGSWKIEVLASFASAVLLAGVAVLMVVESAQRLVAPQPIQYREALVVAVIGLIVNIACVAILGHADHVGDGESHDHNGHSHPHPHSHSEHDHDQAPSAGAADRHVDLNLHSAYLHVITDALTSVLAIGALLGGWLFGWAWLDPIMGIVGAVLIVLWSKNLIVRSATILLDREMDHPLVQQIRAEVEQYRPQAQDQVVDLHLWRVGRNAFACALTIVTHDEKLDAARVRQRLAQHAELVHVTVEIHLCRAGEVAVDDA